MSKASSVSDIMIMIKSNAVNDMFCWFGTKMVDDIEELVGWWQLSPLWGGRHIGDVNRHMVIDLSLK